LKPRKKKSHKKKRPPTEDKPGRGGKLPEDQQISIEKRAETKKGRGGGTAKTCQRHANLGGGKVGGKDGGRNIMCRKRKRRRRKGRKNIQKVKFSVFWGKDSLWEKPSQWGGGQRNLWGQKKRGGQGVENPNF